MQTGSPNTIAEKPGVFFYTDAFQHYDMGPEHPLKPVRLRRTHELLRAYGALDAVEVREPAPCSMSDLRAVHSLDYIEAVQQLSHGQDASYVRSHGHRHNYGFGAGDNPIFWGMYESSLLYTGASVDAAQAVMDGAPVAMNISGGLHHAHHARAAGFCIFNDPAVAIQRLRTRFARVAYVDIDVHHGDGVQEAFYDDPTVLTISIHETGRTLFPGTGFVDEVGEGEGVGYSLNVPVWPGTTDEIWLRAFREGAMPVLRAFDPQAILLQLGADAHYLDPLAHICLTAQGWLGAVKDVKSLGKPIVAVGGGGYNQATVPRMWALAFGELFEMALDDATPASFSYHNRIPALTDHAEPPVSPQELVQAGRHAEETVTTIHQRIFPLHGL